MTRITSPMGPPGTTSFSKSCPSGQTAYDGSKLVPRRLASRKSECHQGNIGKSTSQHIEATLTSFSLALLVVFAFCDFSQAEQRSEGVRYISSVQGFVKDTETGLMWTQKDSYSDLGHSLNWYEAREYVEGLSIGGHVDWRLPTAAELKTIYEPSKTNKDLYGGKLRLDPVFAESGTYNFWTSETAGDCCAVTMTFDYGHVTKNHRGYSGGLGVRAVRKMDD